MKYDLERFKTAQENCYTQVLKEMKNGNKKSHWMWFIFPQIAGLGESPTAKKYEITDIEEAKYYLKDALLSGRLLELTMILAYDIEGKSAEEIFGFPDYLKFHSSMTLFYSAVMADNHFDNISHFSFFKDVIQKYYNGHLDKLTLEILQSMRSENK